MPSNIIKTPADEKRWRKAKEAAAKQGQAEKWPLVMHIFQQMKKEEESQDNKLKAVTPSDTREAKIQQIKSQIKSGAYTPDSVKILGGVESHIKRFGDVANTEKEMHQEGNIKIERAKSIQARKKQIKLIKSEQRKAAANRLYNTVLHIKDILKKAAKSKLVEWQAKEHTPEDHAKMKPLLDQGFHPREAAHLTEVRHAKDTHQNTKATPLSEPMLSLAREVAADHLKDFMEARGATAQPEHNPNIHVQHQAKQAAKQHTGDYKNDLNSFKSSDEFKAMHPDEHAKAVSQFKLNWLKHNKQNMLSNLSQATQKMADVQAQTQAKREQEKHEIRANIARGGHVTGVMPESSAESEFEEPNFDYESDLEDYRG